MFDGLAGVRKTVSCSGPPTVTQKNSSGESTRTAWHSTRTCRAFTNPQRLIAKAAQAKKGLATMFFEGDIADASFYKDEVLESRLAAMLEGIDVRRARA